MVDYKITWKGRLIKRILVLIVIALFLGYLSSCSINEARFMTDNNKYRVTKLNTIIEALENKDAATIKKLFSKSAIEKAGEDEINEGIDYLFTLYNGELLSFDMKGGGISEDIGGGQRTKSTYIRANIITDKESYYLSSLDIIIDTASRNNVGLWNLSLMRSEEKEKYGKPIDYFAGVYCPEIRPEQIDLASGIEHHYETDFGSFTIPKGFYRNPLLSSDEQYIFFETYASPENWSLNELSIEPGQWDFSKDGKNAFQKAMEEKFLTSDNKAGKDKKYSLLETKEFQTKNGYTVLLNAFERSDQEYWKSEYYILDETRYVLVYTGMVKSDIERMQETALSITDSFVWVD